MIKRESIKEITDHMERLMYGFNYAVTFGVEIFENCSDYPEFSKCLKKIFPDVEPGSVNPILVTKEDFWEEIYFGLNYRGDKNAGLELNERKKEKLEKIQKEYLNFILGFTNEKTKFYFYPDERGLYCPVFWGYSFFSFAEEGKCLFIYGLASD